MITPAAGG
jgi:L,D-transpeptidase catalytic domain